MGRQRHGMSGDLILIRRQAVRKIIPAATQCRIVNFKTSHDVGRHAGATLMPSQIAWKLLSQFSFHCLRRSEPFPIVSAPGDFVLFPSTSILYFFSFLRFASKPSEIQFEIANETKSFGPKTLFLSIIKINWLFNLILISSKKM